MANKIELAELVVKLTADAKQFSKELKDGNKEASAFAKGAKQALGGIQDVADGLRNTLRLTAQGMGKFGAAVVKRIPGLTKLRDNLRRTGSAMRDRFAAVVDKSVGAVLGRFSKLRAGAAAMASRVSASVSRVSKTVRSTFTGMAKAVGEISKGFVSLLPFRDMANGAAKMASRVSSSVSKVSRSVRDTLKGMGSAISEISKGFVSLLPIAEITGAVRKVGSVLNQTLVPILRGIGKIATGLGRILIAGLGKGLTALGRIGGTVGRTLMSGLGAALKGLGKIGGAVSGALGKTLAAALRGGARAAGAAARAFISVGAKIPGFITQGVSRLAGTLGKTLTGAIGKAVGAAGTALTTALGAAGVAAAGLAAGVGAAAFAIGKLAIDAAPLEGIGIAFEAMASRAGLSLEDLRQGAAGTVSDFELMRKANVALTGAGADLGKEFGVSMPKLLQIARASARATGQDVGFLFESLVTGVKRNSPLLIDNTGLVLSLSDANAQLATELGKTVDQLTDEEKQIALLRATVKAGNDMVENFGGGQITAAEQIAQFKAQLQNTKDAIGIAFIPALQAMLGPIAQIATVAGPQLIAFAQSAGEWLGTNLPLAIQGLAAIFNGQGTVAIASFGQLVSNVFGPEALEKFMAFAIPVRDWLQVAIPQAVEFVRGAFAFFQAEGPAALNALKSVFETVWPAIQATVQGVVAWFTANLPLIIEAGQRIAAFFTAVLVPAIDNAWLVITNTISAALTAIGGIITAALQIFNGDWQAAWVTIQTAGVAIWANIQIAFSQFLEGVLNAMGSSTEEFLATWKFVFEKGAMIVTSFVNKVKGGLNAIKGAINGLITKVGDLIKKLLGLKVPAVFTPGSPTPFEMGLRGISDAMRQLNSVDLPTMTTELAALPASAAGGARGGDTNQEFNMSVHTAATVSTVIADFATLRAISPSGA